MNNIGITNIEDVIFGYFNESKIWYFSFFVYTILVLFIKRK